MRVSCTDSTPMLQNRTENNMENDMADAGYGVMVGTRRILLNKTPEVGTPL